MAFSKTLIVQKHDIYIFQYKATKSGKIAKYWRQIIERMTNSLRNEVRTKPTYLNCISELNQIYQFQTEGAGAELKEYLKEFKIEVTNDISLENTNDKTSEEN